MKTTTLLSATVAALSALIAPAVADSHAQFVLFRGEGCTGSTLTLDEYFGDNAVSSPLGEGFSSARLQNPDGGHAFGVCGQGFSCGGAHVILDTINCFQLQQANGNAIHIDKTCVDGGCFS
ncbi:uncharacterized protein Triagg1_4082 [Trichoderma aggressivum f. europaeum]|uniref:Uncharacterized protein n=1 Tax=Trichoderma aggressivum f. europaeum TaxID=173218 RepID=A0AAE1IEH4_9HYPO|nr:hypothetical protein Triagg1_4082 [Trichoderma aggressivum f. europaeum]